MKKQGELQTTGKLVWRARVWQNILQHGFDSDSDKKQQGN